MVAYGDAQRSNPPHELLVVDPELSRHFVDSHLTFVLSKCPNSRSRLRKLSGYTRIKEGEHTDLVLAEQRSERCLVTEHHTRGA